MATFEPALKERRTEKWFEADKYAPPFGQYVLYRTEDYLALGCYQRPGEWRFSDGEKEPNPVRAWQPVN